MTKQLIACCDGTWNNPEEPSWILARANVSRLALAIARESYAFVVEKYEPRGG